MGSSPHITLHFFIRPQKFVLDLTKCFFTPLRSRNESFSAVSMEIFFFLFSTVYCILCVLAFIFSNLLRHLTPAFMFSESRSLAFSLMHCFICGDSVYFFLIVFSLYFLHDVRAQGRMNPPIILNFPHTLFIS